MGIPVLCINNADYHDVTEILLSGAKHQTYQSQKNQIYAGTPNISQKNKYTG